MKIRFITIVITLTFIVSCNTIAPEKNNRSVNSQHERSKAAFDELDDKPTIQSSKPSDQSRGSLPRRDEEIKPVRDNPKPVPPTSDKTPDFSSSRYLSAKGYGMSKPESINNAKAELSNIFEAKISSDVTSRIKEVTDSVKGSSFNKSIQSQVNVISNIQLEGVQIGEPQKERSEYVTIAALDKMIAKDKWENDINKIDSEIDILLNKSNKSSSKINKLIPLKKILELWVQREVTLSRLRVIGFSSDFGKKDLKEILQKISDIKSSMLIGIKVSGPSGQSVRDTVAQILTNNDFKVSDSGSHSDVMVTGTIKLDAVNNNNPRFKFSRATVSLNIIDTSSNNHVGQISENERGAGVNSDEASHNAVKKISDKISDKLIQYFN
jgi:hypothetical protein